MGLPASRNPEEKVPKQKLCSENVCHSIVSNKQKSLIQPHSREEGGEREGRFLNDVKNMYYKLPRI